MANCTVPICFDWIIAGHAVATIEASVDVYRNDELIEIDESEVYVATVHNGQSSKLHVTRFSPSEEVCELFTLIMREVGKDEWTGRFEQKLAEMELSEADDRADDTYQERRERELADAA